MLIYSLMYCGGWLLKKSYVVAEGLELASLGCVCACRVRFGWQCRVVVRICGGKAAICLFLSIYLPLIGRKIEISIFFIDPNREILSVTTKVIFFLLRV
jgi:hypothetical protein